MLNPANYRRGSPFTYCMYTVDEDVEWLVKLHVTFQFAVKHTCMAVFNNYYFITLLDRGDG